jgi:hypothetical protein
MEMLVIIVIAFLSGYLGTRVSGPECEPCPEVATEWPVSSCAECSEELGDCLMNFTICQTIVEILQEQLGEEKVKYNKDTSYEVGNDPVFEHNQF